MLGTIVAITVSVVAVRIAGAQVTARHSAPLSTAGVADAVAEERASATDPLDAVVDDGLAVTGDVALGGSSDGSGSSDSGSGSSGSGSGSSGSGSGSSGSGSGSSSGGSSDGVVDDHGGTRTPSVTSAPSGGSDSSGSGGGGSGGGGSDDEVTTTTKASAAATFTKSTTGGAVTVRCVGDTVSLLSVTVAGGWSKEVSGSGPQEVEVSFHSGDSEITVRARCSAGVVDWR